MQLTVTKTMAISMAVVEAARTTSRYFFLLPCKGEAHQFKVCNQSSKSQSVMANGQLPIANSQFGFNW